MGIIPVKVTSQQLLEWTVEIVKAHIENSNLKEEYIASLIKTVHSTLIELTTKES